MATACFVPWPSSGSGGCPCGTYPDPCGSIKQCLPQDTYPVPPCFPPAAECQKLGQCTTCEWIAGSQQVCPPESGGSTLLVLGVIAAAGAVLLLRHQGGVPVARRRTPAPARTGFS